MCKYLFRFLLSVLFLLQVSNLHGQKISGNYSVIASYEQKSNDWYQIVYTTPIDVSLSTDGKLLKIASYDFLFDLSNHTTGITDNKNDAQLKNLKSLEYIETRNSQGRKFIVYRANLEFQDGRFLKVEYAVVIEGSEIYGLMIRNLNHHRKFLLRLSRISNH